MKEEFFKQLSKGVDMKTGNPKGTEIASPEPTGLEEELEQAKEEYKNAQAELVKQQTKTPKDIASHYLAHSRGPKHLCNADPLPYFEEEVSSKHPQLQSLLVQKLDTECETTSQRLSELQGQLKLLNSRTTAISEFANDPSVAHSALDRVVAEEEEEDENEEGATPKSGKKRKRGKEDSQTPRTSARRKVANQLATTKPTY
uniref:Uncharacterized protein n=1 Tax=Paramoeba aestuarina TaxID=180227 RepID=A0A7S4NUS5_9EUKA